jgi:putative lipoic acid-binding regulatory protein
VSEEQSLLEFPCQFAIKVMGRTSPELDVSVVEIIRRHSPDLREGAVTSRPSKGGNYTAITVMIEASSREQLDAIYHDLTASPHVLMAL